MMTVYPATETESLISDEASRLGPELVRTTFTLDHLFRADAIIYRPVMEIKRNFPCGIRSPVDSTANPDI